MPSSSNTTCSWVNCWGLRECTNQLSSVLQPSLFPREQRNLEIKIQLGDNNQCQEDVCSSQPSRERFTKQSVLLPRPLKKAKFSTHPQGCAKMQRLFSRRRNGPRLEPGPEVSPSTCPSLRSPLQYLVCLNSAAKPQQGEEATNYVSWHIYIYIYWHEMVNHVSCSLLWNYFCLVLLAPIKSKRFRTLW